MCVYACVYHKRCDYHFFIVHLDHFVCAAVHMVASNTFFTMLYIFMCVSLSAVFCDVHLYCSCIIHISVTTEIPSEILCHAFTNWSFFPPNIMCVHFPAYSWFVCVSVLHREFLILWPALLAVPLFVNVCVYHINLCMYTTKYTPFFIHNLQKGKIFFVWGWGKIPGCS